MVVTYLQVRPIKDAVLVMRLCLFHIICYQYSCLWQYQYNASKSTVVTFNESKQSYSRCSRVWSVQDIPEKEEFVHLGLICSKYSNSTTSVKHIDRKLRCTCFGLIKKGLHRHGLNPLTSHRIYKSIIIPRALFGCELKPSLTRRDSLTLERSHRLCLKQKR